MRLAAARDAEIHRAAAPAALLARLTAAGTPLSLDDAGGHLTIPPGKSLPEHVVREVVVFKAELVALLRAAAAVEAPRPVVVA